MPWTVNDPPNVAQGWEDDAKRKCVSAANATLNRGGTEEEAIFACIAAAGKSQQQAQDIKTDFRGLSAIMHGIHFAENNDDGFDVEIAATGTWQGIGCPKGGCKITNADLQEFVNNFKELAEVQQVPLKLGHNDKQPLIKGAEDGDPALGWVSRLWVVGNKLLARFTNVPDIIKEAIRKKRYRNVSIEFLSAEYKGKKYKNVLDAVALLGVDAPAVKGLADLDTYLTRKRSLEPQHVYVFSSIKGNNVVKQHKRSEGKRMSNPDEAGLEARLEILEAQAKAQKTEFEKQAVEVATLKKENASLKADIKQRDEVDETKKRADARADLLQTLDEMVKNKQVMPTVRDKHMRDFDEEGGMGEKTVYAVKTLKETIESNDAYFGNEQARMRQQQSQEEEEMAPDDLVVQRTNEYMAKHGEKDFMVAKAAVLRAHPKLAEAYTSMGLEKAGF